MTKTFEEISREAAGLSRSQRLELARLLLESEASDGDPDAESCWHTEIMRRVEAVEEGSAKAIPYTEALARVDAALKR